MPRLELECYPQHAVYDRKTGQRHPISAELYTVLFENTNSEASLFHGNDTYTPSYHLTSLPRRVRPQRQKCA